MHDRANRSCCRALLLALLVLTLAAAACKGSDEEVCRPAQAVARTAWLRYRVAVRWEIERGLKRLEQRLKRAKDRLSKLKAARACAARLDPQSPSIPGACLARAGLARLPTARESAAEQRALSKAQATQRHLTGETRRIDRVDALIKRLDCPADVLRRRRGGVLAERGGERAQLLEAATAATARLLACAADRTIPARAHCR